MAHFSERKMEDLGIIKTKRIGAVVTAVSGNDLPLAYRYPVIRTFYTIERGANAWFLTSASRTSQYRTVPSGSGNIELPAETILEAVRKKGFVIRKK